MIQLHLSIDKQQLCLLKNNHCLYQWSVSTALNGTGCNKDSGQTPLGAHKIKLKIGQNCPINTVFVGRRPTGEIYNSELAAKYPARDWILSRILWLSGCQSSVNRGQQVDTLARYIYIHGTPNSEPMGIPKSHGCIRMNNQDIIQLFDLVNNHTEMLIENKPCPLS